MQEQQHYHHLHQQQPQQHQLPVREMEQEMEQQLHGGGDWVPLPEKHALHGLDRVQAWLAENDESESAGGGGGRKTQRTRRTNHKQPQRQPPQQLGSSLQYGDKTHLQQSLVELQYDSAAAAAEMASDRLGCMLGIDRKTPWDQLQELRRAKEVFELQQAQAQRRDEAMSSNPFLVDYSVGYPGRRKDRKERSEWNGRHHTRLCREFEQRYTSKDTPVEKMLRRYQDEAVVRKGAD
jgi:hypothetical protein